MKGRQGVLIGYIQPRVDRKAGGERDGWVIKQQNMPVKKIKKVKEKAIPKSKRYLPLLMLYF